MDKDTFTNNYQQIKIPLIINLPKDSWKVLKIELLDDTCIFHNIPEGEHMDDNTIDIINNT